MKKIIIILIIAIILLITIVVFNKQNDNEANKYVTGNQHIYKGQRLDPDLKLNIVELSARASYLETKQYIDIKAKKILEQMIMDAEKDKICLVVMSGYRDPERQQMLYDLVDEKDKSFIALPYESEHQTGLAVDFTACPMNEQGKRDDSVERLELKKDFEELPEYLWLINNASKYNFEQSFKENNKDITGFSSESWHWKYLIVDN